MADRTINYWLHNVAFYLEKFRKSQQECRQCRTKGFIKNNLWVCPHCGFHHPFSAREWIFYLKGRRSTKQTVRHREVKIDLESKHPRFEEKLKESKRKTGFKDGLIVSLTSIEKHRVVLTILNLAFFNGIVGPIEGKKFAQALELANEKGVPLISIWTSYGMNMHFESSLFVMPEVSQAVAKLKVPYISILSGTVLGGTSVSFIPGDTIIAERDSSFGFTGKSIIANMIGKDQLPKDFQTVEEAERCGKIDIVAERKDVRNILTNILNVLDPKNYSECTPILYKIPEVKTKKRVSNNNEEIPKTENLRPSDIVSIARHPSRPTFVDYLELFEPFIELKGDREFGNDNTLIGGLALFEGKPVIVIGTEKGKLIEKNGSWYADQKIYFEQGMVGPAGYRKAMRLMDLAEKLQIPIVILVDTPGARMDPESEQFNISFQLHKTMVKMSQLKTLTIAINIGEGGSGGYIAFAGNARFHLMMENSYIATAAPEAKAAVMYDDKKRWKEAADNSKITAEEFLEKGYIDAIIEEPRGGAHLNPETAICNVKYALKKWLEASSLSSST